MKKHRPNSPAHTATQQRSFFPRANRRTETASQPFFQAKLRVGSPGDRFEREADQVADEVVAGGTAPQPQAAVEPGTGPEEEIQRHAAGPVPRASALDGKTALPTTGSGEGRPLPADVRGEVEPALGVELGAVRIHTDEAAAALSEDLGANAFTHGRDIYFAGGQFAPQSRAGKHLLAHELTHVIQQSNGGAASGTVQADFAVEPTHPGAKVRTLTARQVADAIAFNTTTITNPAEIEMVRDILGIAPTPATIDDDFIQAVVRYQSNYHLTQDGRLGSLTRQRLAKEILAEADTLGFAGLGGLDTGVELRTQIRSLIDAADLTYATYRTRIRAASLLQRDVVLADVPTVRALRNHLPWNNFARCVELLGRRAPNHAFLVRQTVVSTALRAAWVASNPAVNPPVGTQHEEGGWVYLNLITGELSVRRAAGGAGAAINLAAPPLLPDRIVVAKFHTHPNLGPGWLAAPSPQDTAVDATHGVPDIVVGTAGVNPAVFQFFASGPDRRAHLAGNRRLPGAGGGLAPQARRDGSFDDQ